MFLSALRQRKGLCRSDLSSRAELSVILDKRTGFLLTLCSINSYLTVVADLEKLHASGLVT